MFGLSFGEILIILVVALMVLGPTGMPRLARTLGKGLREFRKATGDIRGAFEAEFYKLDQEVEKVAATGRAATLESANAPPVDPAEGLAPAAGSGVEGAVSRNAEEAGASALMSAAHAAPEGTTPAVPAALRPPEGTAPAASEAVVASAPPAAEADQPPAEKQAQPGAAGRPADERA